jgi:hypothetical protein
MGKYEPLGQFLRKQEAEFLPMRFAEIERLLGDKLPASSKEHRAWWSNNPSNNVMTRQWLDAGYETEAVDLAAERLVFRKVKRGEARAVGQAGSGNTGGGKYRALGLYLKERSLAFIPMTFTEIENVIGGKLPASKVYPAWWSNNPSNNTMTKEWLDAGYQTESVDIAGERLVFRRVIGPPKFETGNVADDELPDHPIWGSMAGTITVMPGVDLTEPMEFEWSGKLYNE